MKLLIALVMIVTICGCNSAENGQNEDQSANQNRMAMKRDVELKVQVLQRDKYVGTPVQLKITLQNNRSTPVDLQFSSGKSFDIQILNAEGAEVWKWSHGKSFTMAMRSVQLKPGEAMNFTEIWDTKNQAGGLVAAGTYQAKVEITATPHFETTVSFELKPR